MEMLINSLINNVQILALVINQLKPDQTAKNHSLKTAKNHGLQYFCSLAWSFDFWG